MEKILGDLKKEGQSLEEFAEEKGLEEEKETPPAPPAEEQPVEKQTPAEEDKKTEEQLPFHKHPRWKKMYSENKSLRDEIASLRDDVKNSFAQMKSGEEVQVPPWFSSIMGDDKETWQKFMQWDSGRQEQLRAQIFEELEAKKEAEQESQKEWDSWLEESLDGLREEGKTFDRNKLMKVMLDYQPIDNEGNYDFKKGYQIYEMIEKSVQKKMDARKQIADTTIKDDKTEAKSKTYRTWADTRREGWDWEE